MWVDGGRIILTEGWKSTTMKTLSASEFEAWAGMDGGRETEMA